VLKITFSESIWPCIAAATNHLEQERTEEVPDLVKSGLNFLIILGSVCYAEGVLEALLRGILQCRRTEFQTCGR
jgi:hypothetical protein